MSSPIETIPTMMFSVITNLHGLKFSAGIDVDNAGCEKNDRHADVSGVHHV
jgi:hypothetical protein